MAKIMEGNKMGHKSAMRMTCPSAIHAKIRHAILPTAAWLILATVVACTPIGANTAEYNQNIGSEVARISFPKVIKNIAWSPDSQQIASVAKDGGVRVTSGDNFQNTKDLLLTNAHLFDDVAFTPDGQFVVVASYAATRVGGLERDTALTLIWLNSSPVWMTVS